MLFPGISADDGNRYGLRPPLDPPVGVCRAFELGCGQDTDLEQTRRKKAEQHAATYEELERQGWTVERHVISLGHTGALPNDLFNKFEALGVSRGHECRELAKRLQRILIRKSHNMVVLRRRLEREYGVAVGGGPCHRGRPPE